MARVTPDNPFAAAQIGELYRTGRPYHHPRSLARISAIVGTAPVACALDVACGTGLSTIALAEHAAYVVGLDVSPEMMGAAPARPGVGYALGRAEALPFAGGCFDAVTCCSGVHWFEQERFFAELHRVMRRSAWIGLYDHYFLRMRHVAGFSDWARALFARYPLPPRNPQVGDPRSVVPDGFELVASESFEDPIEMTREGFADYQLTVSHCVDAVERGTPRAEVHAWLLESLEPLYDGATTRTVEFIGSITCLRRVP
jgi:ubiquinone/menaquinone biosynthesis C-methylase UbiE